MRVLLTRPHADSATLAAILQGHGIDSVIEPLLDIRYVGGPPIDLSNVQALLMTSANGVRAYANRNAERHLPVYAVGDATAREAKASGFDTVHSAAGDVATLAALVHEKARGNGGVLVHPAGTRVAGDLAGLLDAGGHTYRREVLYSAEPAAAFSVPLLHALQNGDLDGVLLYSPRTARIFVRLIGAAGQRGAAAAMTAFCLSPAVADAVASLPWRRIETAAAPDQESLLSKVLESAP